MYAGLYHRPLQLSAFSFKTHVWLSSKPGVIAVNQLCKQTNEPLLTLFISCRVKIFLQDIVFYLGSIGY